MHSVSPESLKDNVFKLISQDWMLITRAIARNSTR